MRRLCSYWPECVPGHMPDRSVTYSLEDCKEDRYLDGKVVPSMELLVHDMVAENEVLPCSTHLEMLSSLYQPSLITTGYVLSLPQQMKRSPPVLCVNHRRRLLWICIDDNGWAVRILEVAITLASRRMCAEKRTHIMRVRYAYIQEQEFKYLANPLSLSRYLRPWILIRHANTWNTMWKGKTKCWVNSRHPVRWCWRKFWYTEDECIQNGDLLLCCTLCFTSWQMKGRSYDELK